MEKLPFSHTSVLLWECIDSLNIREGLTYVDCTTGFGGHSLEIARRIGPRGRLICFDRDRDALKAAGERLRDYADRITFVNENFDSLSRVLREQDVDNLGGVLADLGCSSYQFDASDRGFAYNHEARLDMRMNQEDTLDAYQVVNTYSEDELKRILYEYGEEKFAPRIARAIVSQRAVKPIFSTTQLSELVKCAIPAAARADGPHPAKRTFQAIRIEVNGELDCIRPMLEAASAALIPGGRLAVISFHSLEDRIVKQTFANLSQGCTCPKDFPVCVCGKKPTLRVVNRKPILPGEEEIPRNPRARSAKLRVAEKIADTCGISKSDKKGEET